MRITFIILIILISGLAAVAQLSGYNLAETQLGDIPDQGASNQKNIYDQLNLQYRHKSLKAIVRLEQFYSTDSLRGDYTEFSQYSLSFRKNGWNFRLGNFYETLGRGLLFRGYEIKNSVFEDRIYRVRQGFYRDVRGAFAGYRGEHFEVKALYGKSLNNQLPPGNSERRIDQVAAGELNWYFGQQQIGTIFLDNDNVMDHSQYVSVTMGGNLPFNFDYYGEFARRINDDYSIFDLNDHASYGGYVNLNYSARYFGFSLEWKNYNRFFIGSGISDPPTLVKEQTYKLLNRSTHVSDLNYESGIQIETFVHLSDKNSLTINHSRATNRAGNDYRFQEYFMEWSSVTDQHQIKVFGDYSFDELKLEKDRLAAGFYATKSLPKSRGISMELEGQHLKKDYSGGAQIWNMYSALIFSQTTKFSAALIFEYTNDPVFADRIGTETIEKNRNFWGVNVSYKANTNNQLQLFAGQRRGGPACTAGICYEVLDFEGMELRWTIRF